MLLVSSPDPLFPLILPMLLAGEVPRHKQLTVGGEWQADTHHLTLNVIESLKYIHKTLQQVYCKTAAHLNE